MTQTKQRTSMTMNEVFERLVAMADQTNGGARGANVLGCDILHQVALYRLQADLVRLMADVANAAGPDAQRTLVARFPFAFECR